MALISKKQRKEWIKDNKKLIKKLPVSAKLLMLILYINRSIKTISNKRTIGLTYAYMFSLMELIKDLKFAVKIKKGRVCTYKITQKGVDYCEIFLRGLR